MTGLREYPEIMTSRKECSQCGLPFSEDAPLSICPACEFRGALQLEDEADPTDATPVETHAAHNDSPLQSIPFGAYELIEEIARGGMGIVYKARQKRLDRIVAVKMVLAAPFAAKSFVQRFRAEAAAAAILQHPNIIRIHDVGVRDGQHFFSMDYVEGQNLAQLVGVRPLSARRAAQYLKFISEAIHYAHEQGILHRDLKPSNILIDSATDQPRVSDFGLAKRLDGESSMTVTGQLLGSPHFMSPEQARGERGKTGRPTDVYGLGAILYYALAARAPFQGDSLGNIVTQVINTDPVSPRLLNPAIPADLETICLKCLEKDPARRYPTALDVAEELGRFLRDEPIHARPTTRIEKAVRWCRRKPAAAAAGLLLLILAIGSPIAAFRIQGEKKRAEANEFTALKNAYVADMNLAQVAMQENNLADAKKLLDRHIPENANEIGLRGWEWRYLRGQWKSDELTTLQSRAADVKWTWAVAFSMNGNLLAAASGDRKVSLWSPAQRRKVGELLHPGNVRTLAFSSRDPILATIAEDQFLRIWDLQTQINIWRTPLATHAVTWGAVAFSPDGTQLAFGATAGTVIVSNLVTKSQFSLETAEPGITEIAFSPDGRALATRNYRTNLRLWDLASRKVKFTWRHGGWGESGISFSPDGSKLASTSLDRVLNVWNTASGEKVFSATNRIGFPTAAAFSPNGKRLAVSNSEQTITIRETEAWTSLGELKGHLGAVAAIAYSPSGELLATGSDDGELKLWGPDVPAKKIEGFPLPDSWLRARAFSADFRTFVFRTNSSLELWDIGSMKRMTTLPSEERTPTALAVSSGGKWLAGGGADGVVKLWANEGNALTEKFHFRLAGEIRTISFSPDARRCAAAGSAAVCIWDLTNGTELRKYEFATSSIIRFSPDGRSLAAGSQAGKLKVWDLSGVRRPLETQAHEAHLSDLAFFPDGKTLASGGWDRTAKLWDTARLELLTQLPGESEEATALAVAPDGSRVAVATREGTVTLWLPHAGQAMPVAALQGNKPFPTAVGFLPDGNTIVSTSGYELLVRRAPSFAEIAKLGR